jgi:hypothetical protein
MPESERRLRQRAAAMWLSAGGGACSSEDGAGADTPESVRWRSAYVEAGFALPGHPVQLSHDYSVRVLRRVVSGGTSRGNQLRVPD